MKKKIFIASHCMELGGAERSLLGLLNAIDYEKYEVDLMLYRHSGEWMKYLPKETNLLPADEDLTLLAVPFMSVIKKRKWKMAFGRLQGKTKAVRYKKKEKYDSNIPDLTELEYSHKYTIRYSKRQEKQYDLAISFLMPHYYVAEKVKASKKIAWIHTDYSNYFLDKKSEFKMWKQYDSIISISPKCTEGFLKVFPELKEKIVEIGNILSKELILQQSKEFDVQSEMLHEKNEIILCSVGRFTHAKNFENVPKICALLNQSEYKFKWFLIGYGGEEEKIRNQIKANNMENQVIILGKKENPYPYMKECDFYIQPSLYEGKAVTVIEAQILEKPVIITNYSSSESQLENGVDGVIVPMDNKECAKGILDVVRDSALQLKMIQNCKNRDYSNKEEINKLYQMVEII